MPTSLSLQYAGELVSELGGAAPAILAGGMTSSTRFLISAIDIGWRAANFNAADGNSKSAGV